MVHDAPRPPPVVPYGVASSSSQLSPPYPSTALIIGGDDKFFVDPGRRTILSNVAAPGGNGEPVTSLSVSGLAPNTGELIRSATTKPTSLTLLDRNRLVHRFHSPNDTARGVSMSLRVRPTAKTAVPITLLSSNALTKIGTLLQPCLPRSLICCFSLMSTRCC